MSSFAQIPRFGEAIRKFRASVTAAEGMTAREYEQVLLVSFVVRLAPFDSSADICIDYYIQCLLPVISGLLPSFEPLANRLIYSLNVWFALAKLHIHTAETLEDVDNELSTFGRTLRAFKAKGDTWQAQQVANGSTSLDKPWSIQTPKTHTMGHTLSSVQVFRPTVGYTTEMVSALTSIPKYYPLLTF